jgi:serine/threonine-protein kinase RsbT
MGIKMKLNLKSSGEPVVVKTLVPQRNGLPARGAIPYTKVAPIRDQQTLIESERGILSARQQGRHLAETLGFSRSELTLIATVISELGRNIVQYAGSGKISVSPIDQGQRSGISITAQDKGPGISNVALALQAGYSTSQGLRGGGLPGVKRAMDEMEVTSEMGQGTSVVVRKWKR